MDTVYTNNYSSLLENFRSQSPDIIVTDIIPYSDMKSSTFSDGLETIQQIKSETEKDIFVIVVSGNSNVDSVIKAVNAGANKYLKNP